MQRGLGSCLLWVPLLTTAWFSVVISFQRNTIKRMCIKNLPPVLCIQLKRFDYDWEANRALKFDDYFKVLQTLDKLLWQIMSDWKLLLTLRFLGQGWKVVWDMLVTALSLTVSPSVRHGAVHHWWYGQTWGVGAEAERDGDQQLRWEWARTSHQLCCGTSMQTD